LLRIVSGQLGTAASHGLRGDTILIARNLGPAELLEYDRRRLKGVILEEGSLTAHVVIVARAMGVPVIGRVRGMRGMVREGDPLLLDADQGVIDVRPTPAMVEAFEGRFARNRERQQAYAAMRDLEPVTRDGRRITVMINAGLRDDTPMLSLTGADGIGLFRTEFQFLVSATLPARERQTRLYRDVLDAAGDRPVVFRTVDIGGDKVLPYLRHNDGESEGWRCASRWSGTGCSRSRRARCWKRRRGARSTSCSRWSPNRGSSMRPRRCSMARSPSCAGRRSRSPKRSAMARCWKCRRWPNAWTCWRRGCVPVDRHQRSHAVPVRGGPRQSQAGRTL
jgi:phosphohistidine swiveling domain-containing protein